MKKTKVNFWIIVALLSIIACNKHENLDEENTSNQSETILSMDEERGEELILGAKLKNPYSFENMKRTLSIIAQSKNKTTLSKIRTLDGKSILENIDNLTPTHYYVVFLPENDDHLDILNEIISSRKFVCREFPMDYEIKQYGNIYIDKRTKNPDYPVLYVSIPASEPMPNVPYEKLEDLFLIEEDDLDETIEIVSNYLVTDEGIEKFPMIDIRHIQASDKHSIQAESISFSTKELSTDDVLKNSQSLFGIFNKRYYPEGNVRVQNAETGIYEPLRNAEIEIYNWFFNAYCYTDNNGYFRCRERFRREMGVYITFRGANATIRSSWNELLGIRVSDKIGNIRRSNNGRTFNIDYSDKHIWRKAIAHNSLQYFNEYMVAQGIGQRANRLNIWVFGGDKNNGMTPMLQVNGYSPYIYRNLFSGWFRFLTPLTIPIAKTLAIRKSLLPDVIFTFNNDGQKKLERLVFHELAHSIHARQTGSYFWNYFTHKTTENIVDSGFKDPYRNGTYPYPKDAMLIALCEGWGNFIENKSIYDRYSDADYSCENFEMYTTPTEEKNTRLKGWFLHGLMWDLTDGVTDSVFLKKGTNPNFLISRGTDNVQISIKDLFNALQKDVYTGYDLKHLLKRNHPSQSQDIELLFNAYGY